MKRTVFKPYVKVVKLGSEGFVRRKSPHVGKWLRDELIDMGPTYVKLGQIVSTRTDIFPARITKPLEDLRENVSAVDFESMDRVFHDAHGKPSRSYFKHIDVTPIACASISQVYRATLHNDRVVVVKIQKPGIREQITQDIDAIRNLLTVCSKLVPSKAITDLLLVTNELAVSLMAEIDFNVEMKNINRFRTIRFDQLVVPRVFSNEIRSTVLIMEYVPGASLFEQCTPDLANTVMLLFLRCLIEHGLLHADMHAGNLAKSSTGQIIWYDFGSVVSYDVETRDAFKRILRGFLFRNTHDIIDCILENKFIHLYDETAANYQELRPETYMVLYTLINYAFGYTKETDIDSLLSNIMTDPFVSVGSLPFYIDTNLILLFKTVTSLEGVCKEIDPDFSYDSLYTSLLRNLIDVDLFYNKIQHDIRSVADQTEQDTHPYTQQMKSKVLVDRTTELQTTHTKMQVVGMLAILSIVVF